MSSIFELFIFEFVIVRDVLDPSFLILAACKLSRMNRMYRMNQMNI
jgi:hypothetical protein